MMKWECTALSVCLMMMHVMGGNKGGNMAQGGLNEWLNVHVDLKNEWWCNDEVNACDLWIQREGEKLEMLKECTALGGEEMMAWKWRD